MLMGVQLLVWAMVSAATIGLFAERALILGQAIGNLVILPWQLSTLRKALGLDRERFLRAIGAQAAILVIGSILLAILAGYIQFDSVLRLALASGIFCVMSWITQYFLVLEQRHRAIFPEVGHLIGLAQKGN